MDTEAITFPLCPAIGGMATWEERQPDVGDVPALFAAKQQANRLWPEPLPVGVESLRA
jgi:hypothetical protein